MYKIIAIVCAFFLISGCSLAPLLNIENATISSLSSGQQPPIESIERSIFSSVKKRGWSAKIISPGLIEASIIVRTHEAKIQITYTNDSYSLLYIDSKNLSKGENFIHKNYNSWVAKLHRAIQRDLNQLQ